MLNSFKKNCKNKGFTLIELLVTITMFVIITGVVLVNSNKFDNTILLNNFVYDVALTIKQAQLYGVSVKENSQETFRSVYGVLFDTSLGGVGSPTNFALFESSYDKNISEFQIYSNLIDTISQVDINKTCSTYYPNCIQKYTMRKGTYIKNICVGKDGECKTDLNGKLLIMFKRPSPEPIIITLIGENMTSDSTYAEITLSSAGGDTSSVVVNSVGQIYVKKK